MAEARRLIGGLRPPVLDEAGVVPAIEYLVAEHQRHDGPEIEFVHEVQFDRLAPPLESALFRIVQECLTNACRYSQSPKVRVELRQVDDRVRIDVQDWGVGFDPKQIGDGHFGLRGIRERARLLGGAVSIQTAAAAGHPHHGRVPLDPAGRQRKRGEWQHFSHLKYGVRRGKRKRGIGEEQQCVGSLRNNQLFVLPIFPLSLFSFLH